MPQESKLVTAYLVGSHPTNDWHYHPHWQVWGFYPVTTNTSDHAIEILHSQAHGAMSAAAYEDGEAIELFSAERRLVVEIDETTLPTVLAAVPDVVWTEVARRALMPRLELAETN